ncbi:putative RNA-directed DNA polymerase from transposon BS [Takifugu flavidus]|uniref:Putative RNA-directed DNA polymerase from transposon BS n=1 Tax=Takifugu flavidus TaxID=433684 RepID=A0A5C6MIX3_9TELE|nr:putative RNA-directed DNA polymerase from transposon BS [Takifugu flavidus]
MENQLQQNNICGVWKGLKTISGFKEQKSQPVGDRGWANDLNLFFNRFDQVPPHPTPPPAQSPAVTPAVTPATVCACNPLFLLSPLPLSHELQPIHSRHFTPWPMPIPPTNTSLLQPVPHTTPGEEGPEEEQGQESDRSGWHQLQAPEVLRRPAVWDLQSHVQPEPEAGESATAVEDVLHRPSAEDTAPQGAQQLQAGGSDVSSDEDAGETHPRHLRPLVSSFMDPLQFAYQPSIGVDDAVIYLLHTSLTHLEKAGSTPRLLGDKLQVAGVDHHLTTWILDYLTQRPQFVRVKGSQSDRLLCSTSVPQGTVLAPFLFTLYTADFSYSTSSCHLQKFSDDSAAVGLITDGDDTEYRELIQDFVDWSLRNNLQINAGKTKELVVDFRRRNNLPPAPVNILGTDVDVVESYKYPGVHLNNNLDWTHNTDALVKKGNSRLFLLRRLRSFGVQGPLLRTFYDSVVGSAIFYGIVCWSSSITDRDRKRMDRLVRRASSVLGCPLDSVEVVGNGRMMAKLSSMLNNTSHPLQDTLTALGSSFSERLLHPRCVKERYRRSFLPAAVRLHNKHNAR